EFLLDPGGIRFLERDIEECAGVADSGGAAHRILMDLTSVTSVSLYLRGTNVFLYHGKQAAEGLKWLSRPSAADSIFWACSGHVPGIFRAQRRVGVGSSVLRGQVLVQTIEIRLAFER